MGANNNVPIRIIDANLNRAREALRVMEEYARLGLEDVDLSGEIKETRHALARAVADFENRCQLTTGSLIAARDIVGDVGTEIGTETEYQRSDECHVAMAAGKRLSEALRGVEEYGKTLDPAFAADIEKLRYRGYEIERRLTLILRARNRFGHVRLYVIITEVHCRRDWFATAEAALRGGADCLQLREKDLPDRQLLDRAKRMSVLCREHEALFILNDRPDIAVGAGAHGVHLGQGDMPVSAARRVLSASALIGVSTHTIEQADRAAAEAPDYIAVGPMFATSTKPQSHIAGTSTLTEARTRTALPLVAIGGISVQNASDVLAAARCTLCVCRSVTAQDDVESAARSLRKVIDQRPLHVGVSAP